MTWRSDRHKTLLVGTFLLLFAALMFSRQMAGFPLWQDEGWSIIASQLPDWGALNTFFRQDFHPPLFTLLLRLWESIAGDSFFALRMTAFLSTMITVALVYRIGLDLFNPKAAAAAAVITITSDFVLSIAITTRQYTLYIMLAALTFWLYRRYSRGWSFRWGLAYTLAGAAAIYTLYWSAFILLAQGIHCLIFTPRRLKHMLIPAALISIAYLPWLPVLRFTVTAPHESGALRGAGGGYHTSLPLNQNTLDIVLFNLFGVPSALFAGLALAGLSSSINAGRLRGLLPDSKTALIGLWLGVPLMLPVLVTLLGLKLIVLNPLIGLVPAMGLLAGHVLGQMKGREYGLILLITLATNLTTSGAWHPADGAPWWDAAAYLKGISAPQDALVIENSDPHAFAISLHMSEGDVPFNRIIRRQHIDNGWWSEPGDTDALAIINEYHSIWLIEYYPQRDLRPDLEAMGFVPTTPAHVFPIFIRHETFITRYARPPQGEPIVTFRDNIRLREFDHFQDDRTLGINLTWDALQIPEAEYTVSAFLLNSEGTLVAQDDSYPLAGESPTSSWLPGGLYFDRHNLAINALPPGEYQLGLGVYTWQDNVNLTPDPCSDADCQYFILDSINILDGN